MNANADVSGTLLRALKKRDDWTVTDAQSLLEQLATQLGGRVDFEPPDENWGRVLVHRDEVAAFVCSLAPIAMVGQAAAHLILDPRLETIRFTESSHANLKVDPRVLEQLVGRELSGTLDSAAASPNDIWWETVT